MVTGTFLSPLRMEDTGDGEHFLLLEPLIYVSVNGVRYEVPAYFITDLNSVPWFFRRLIPKSNSANRPACLHDWAYATGISKYVADRLYREAMEAIGVHPKLRWILFQSVDKFGQASWNRHAKTRKAKEAA